MEGSFTLVIFGRSQTYCSTHSLLCTTIMSDSYPPGEMAWTNVQADIQQVVQQRKTAGDNKLYYIAFDPQTGPWGEDYHPTVATHAAMATKLADFIKAQGL